jgi:hypothetical protein
MDTRLRFNLAPAFAETNLTGELHRVVDPRGRIERDVSCAKALDGSRGKRKPIEVIHQSFDSETFGMVCARSRVGFPCDFK